MSEQPPAAELADVGVSRARLLALGAAGAATVVGLGSIGPLVRRALAAPPEAELDALNLMLFFEHLELSLYERGLRSFEADGEKDLLQLLSQLIDEERQHRDTLVTKIETLGGKPLPKGNYSFAYPNVYELLRLAKEAELAGIRAYNGAIRALESVESRELAASIVQVEGRHLAAVRLQRGDKPVPEALDPGVQEFGAHASVEKFTGEY
jgi:rubrerythrin